MNALYDEAKKMINGKQNILIVSHRKPDADTLGAALCLKIWLNKIGKEVTLACVDKPANVFDFLPYVHDFVCEFDLEKFDLMIVVDAGANYMTGFHLKYENLFKVIPVINIDHHASNDKYGTLNIVDKDAASTTVILYRMLQHLGIEIDAQMATCLLAGVYSDTGSFMHSNTSKEVYAISADLMTKGAHVSMVSKKLFGNKPVSTLRLWGRVLEKAYVTDDHIVMSVVRDPDYGEVKAKPDELSGVVDYLNMVPGSKFAVLINEDKRGNVKGSFRTRNNNVDLSKIAATFGGGGHAKASGFTLPGKLQEEVTYKIVASDDQKKPLSFGQ